MKKYVSVKKNFFWSSILTVAGYIFPLLTFPYVTRVLGAESFGSYQFADSVISYFCILSLLGIGNIGIREISKVKENREKMSEVFSGLLLLNLSTAFLSIILLIILIYVLPVFSSHSPLLFIGISRILCGVLTIEWLFKGVEDFKYITVRAITIRIIYVISVFVFVRTPNDYVTYFLLTSLITVVNAFINIFYSRHFVSFSFKRIIIKPFIYPFITLGLFQILTAIYSSLNPVYLGFVGGDVQVGYYTTAVKIHHVILSLYTAFTGVMLPRMSALLSQNKIDDFRIMINKSFSFLMCFSFPLMVYSLRYAPEIISVLAGNSYEAAIPCLRIVLPLIFVIGYEQILVIQILVPLRKDKAILTNSIIGALVCIISNLILVPSLFCNGSALVWLFSELFVMLSAQYFVYRYISIAFPFRLFLQNILYSIPILIILYFSINMNINKFYNLCIGALLVSSYYYFIYVHVLKMPMVIEIIESIKNKIYHV